MTFLPRFDHWGSIHPFFCGLSHCPWAMGRMGRLGRWVIWQEPSEHCSTIVPFSWPSWDGTVGHGGGGRTLGAFESQWIDPFWIIKASWLQAMMIFDGGYSGKIGHLFSADLCFLQTAIYPTLRGFRVFFFFLNPQRVGENGGIHDGHSLKWSIHKSQHHPSIIPATTCIFPRVPGSKMINSSRNPCRSCLTGCMNMLGGISLTSARCMWFCRWIASLNPVPRDFVDMKWRSIDMQHELQWYS